MTIKRITEYAIFEGYDGNETVYCRLPGEEMRELYSASGDTIDKLKEIKENQLWANIRELAKTNIALQNALDQCIIIYKLIKDNDNGI